MCAPIPLTSLTEDIAALQPCLRERGAVSPRGTCVCGRRDRRPEGPRVKSLVYIAALAPAEGETVADVFYRAKPHPEAPHLAAGCAWAHLDARRGFCPRSRPQGFTGPDRHSRSRAAADCGEMHSGESPRPAWKTKPSWFLLAEEDRMIAPETQRYMAERMGAKIRAHHVDHSPMHTAPDVVVGVILEAARETFAC